jgi:hypothetical protein
MRQALKGLRRLKNNPYIYLIWNKRYEIRDMICLDLIYDSNFLRYSCLTVIMLVFAWVIPELSSDIVCLQAGQTCMLLS